MKADKMPQRIREVFEHVKQEFYWITRCWTLYQGLFRKTPEQFQMLFLVSEDFFSIILNLLQREVILGLCRIYDPANVNRKPRICIELLKHEIEDNNDTILTGKITILLNEISNELKPLRIYRNNRAAHKDKMDSFCGNLVEIPDVTDNVVERVRLTALMILMNVETYYNHDYTISDITSRDTANTIVSVLRIAIPDKS